MIQDVDEQYIPEYKPAKQISLQSRLRLLAIEMNAVAIAMLSRSSGKISGQGMLLKDMAGICQKWSQEIGKGKRYGY